MGRTFYPQSVMDRVAELRKSEQGGQRLGARAISKILWKELGSSAPPENTIAGWIETPEQRKKQSALAIERRREKKNACKPR